MSPCRSVVSAMLTRIVVSCTFLLGALGMQAAASAQCPGAPIGVSVRRLGCSSEVSLTLNGPTVGVDIRRSAPEDLSGNISTSTLLGTIPTSLLDTGVRTFRDMTASPNSEYVYWAVAKGSAAFCNQSFASAPRLSLLPSASDIDLQVTTDCEQAAIQWTNFVEIFPENRYSYLIELRRENADNPSDVEVLQTSSVSFVGHGGPAPAGRHTYVVKYTLPCGVVEIRSPIVIVGASPEVTAPRDFVSVLSGSASPGQSALPAVLPSGIDVHLLNVAWTWTRDGVPIPSGGLGGRADVNPANGALTIQQPRLSDAGEYRVTAFGPCGSANAAVGLIVNRRFAADVNDTGSVSVQDLFDFLSAFFGAQ